MADGKWIPGLTADTPVVDAARRVLSARLEVIRHYLPLAAYRPEEDIEYVHQLRVATRRAGAAIKIFKMCLPARHARSARKATRRIRHAAGAARDWDVFLEMLAEWSAKRPLVEVPALDFLRGYAFLQRASAQAGLVEVAEDGIDAGTIVASLEPPDDFDAPRHLSDLALPLINELVADFDKETARKSDNYEHLHRIRILGKRLRYAMEIVAACFAPPFRKELYPAVEEMQEILGDANDSHVAEQRLSELRDRLKASRPADWARYKPGLERLIQWHRRRLPEARKRFAAWLKRWRQLRRAPHLWARASQVPALAAESEKT